ncbi:MAG: histidine phosphotransferase family protein [Acetobacteraceae bacterium]
MSAFPADPDEVFAVALADALCARLCHDLSSPLGSLMGALEVAVESPESTEEALSLASETAIEMAQRLRLLRAAWAGASGEMSAQALGELATGLPKRVTVALDGLGGGVFPAPIARVLLNLMLLGAEALPNGGTIALSGAPDADMLVMVDGPNAAWPPGLVPALAGLRTMPDNARAVQAPLVAMLARTAGLRLSLLMPGGLAGPAAAPLLLSPG